MITKKYKTPIYGTPFTIVIYDNDREFEDKFKDWNFSVPISQFDGGVFNREGMLYIVLSAEKNRFPTPGIIAHEALHLVNEIFIDISHNTFSRYDDEPEAYLLGWIVNRIHELLNKN